MWWIALVLGVAEASEVGVDKMLGVGVTGGYPSGLTAKLWLDPGSGVSATLGVQGARVAYERDLAQMVDWPFAQFDLYGSVGAAVSAWDRGRGGWDTPIPSAGLGIGVSLRFHDFPLDAYIDSSAYLAPLEVDRYPLPLEYFGGGGARWHF